MRICFIKMNQLFFLSLIVLFTGCKTNSTEKQKDATAQISAPEASEVQTDTTILKLKPVLTELLYKELSVLNNNVSILNVSNIQYHLISLKDYYKLHLDNLKAQQHLSVDKEKTKKALAYLEKMVATSQMIPEIYEVKFHHLAKADKLNYNEDKTFYLNKDLKELTLIFPN